MATYFGEVLPIHSRAVEDNEDEDVEIPSVYFNLNPKYTSVSTLPSYGLICVGTGLTSSIFLQSYLLRDDHELLGTIRLNTPDIDGCDATAWGLDYRRRPDTLGKLMYDAQNSVLYCLCDKDVPPEYSSEIARHLVEYSQTPVVTSVILTSLPASEFKTKSSMSSLEYPFLRQLHTQQFKDNVTIPGLETPNTVSGLPAALLTECEVREFPGLLVVCYSDSPEVDSTSVRCFEPALKLSCLQAISKPPDSCRQALMQHVRDARIDRGNLYF